MTTRFDQLSWICDVQESITMGGKGGGQTSTSTTTPPPEVMDQYKQVLGQVNQVAQQPLNLYSGQMVAPFTGMQNAAFDSINQAQGMSQPYINQATANLGDSTQDLWSQAQQFNPQTIQQYMNPYTQQVVDATRANMNENNASQQNALRSRAISSGAFGGDRAGVAAAEMARQQRLADDSTIAGLYNNAYQSGLGAFQQQQGQQLNSLSQNAALNQAAAGQYANLGTTAMNNALTGANAQLGAGTLQQQLNQAALNVPYQQYQQTQAYPFQTAQWLANTSLGLGSGMGGTTTQTGAGADGASQTIGNLIGLAGAGASIFSDRRVKEDVRRVGHLDDGSPVYIYKYKGHSKPQMGVMAQDMEKTNPDSVGEIGGIKTVNYDKLADGGSVSPFDVPDQSMSLVPQANAPIGQGGLPVSPIVPQNPDNGIGMADYNGMMGMGQIKKAFGETSPRDYMSLSPEDQVQHDLNAEEGMAGVLARVKDPNFIQDNQPGLGTQLKNIGKDFGRDLKSIFGFADGGLIDYESILSPGFGIADAGESYVPLAEAATDTPVPAGLGADVPRIDIPAPAPPSAPTASPDGAPALSYETDPALAIANAGFGMAAAGSPNFGQNLGAGALAGLKNWSEQKKLGTEMEVLRENLRAKREAAEQDRLDRAARLLLSQAQLDETKAYHRTAEEDRDLKREQQAEQNIANQVTKFATQLDKSGVPDFESTLSKIESKVKGYKPEDLPGFGRIESILDPRLLSTEGRALRQDVQRLINTELRNFSGAAVTEQESVRKLRELGVQAFTDPKAFLDGLANVRREFNEKKRNLVAGIDDKVLDRYQSQGGIELKRGKQESDGDTADVPVFSSPNDEGYKALPSGAPYKDSKGNLRRKK